MMRIFLALAIAFLPALGLAISSEDYYGAGVRLYKKKDYEKAIQYFHAAIEQNPDMWQAYQYMGQSYFQTANRTEALVAIRTSLKLHPKNPELRRFMDKIEGPSPWMSVRSWGAMASYLSLVISLLTLAYVVYWTRRNTHRQGP
jgi:tetratricopeptide (TPR) repeat protein